jgi:hypothetical protein
VLRSSIDTDGPPQLPAPPLVRFSKSVFCVAVLLSRIRRSADSKSRPLGVLPPTRFTAKDSVRCGVTHATRDGSRYCGHGAKEALYGIETFACYRMLGPCPCRPRCSCGECFVTRSLDDDHSLACYHAGAIVIAPAGSGICRTGYTRIVREVALPSGAGCTCSPCNNGRICERLTDKLHALAATIQPPVPGRAWRLFFLGLYT